VEIPPAIRQRLMDVHGGAAAAWLEELPLLLATLREQWSFEPDGPIWGNYSVVLPGQANGEPACLKLVPPSDISRRELAVQRSFDGRSAARVVAFDSDRGAMLMERAIPGDELTRLYKQGRDDEATSIACAVMRQLPKEPAKADSGIETAEERAAGLDKLWVRYDGGTGPIPPDIADRARCLFRDLIGSQSQPVIIHGDLHHENILSSQRGWLVIDPHGLIAEPEFETYALLRNPNALFELPDLIPITRRRIDQMVDELGYDRERIKGWGFACAILSAWWTIEDHGDGGENDVRAADAIWRS
jgi:streptomycin 6-kinase